MAVEVLITCEPRSEEVSTHIDYLLKLTDSNLYISSNDKESIKGSLSWLKSQSIGQAGRTLAKNRLGKIKYYNLSASKFFTYCYKVRSNLVHGSSETPNRQELGILSSEITKFVSDLLTNDLSNKDV